jgi:hypothetical protein
VRSESVDEVPVGQPEAVQYAGISRITLDAIPDIDIGLRFAHGLVVRVFALVDGAVGVVLLLHGAELFFVPSAADAISLPKLCTFVILELLEQVFFSLAQSLFAGGKTPNDSISRGVNSPYIRRLLTHRDFRDAHCHPLADKLGDVKMAFGDAQGTHEQSGIGPDVCHLARHAPSAEQRGSEDDQTCAEPLRRMRAPTGQAPPESEGRSQIRT